MSGRLVVFDLGRVLVRICNNWQHACEVAGVPAPSRQIDEAMRAEAMRLVIENETGRLDHINFTKSLASVLDAEHEHVLALSDVYLLGPYEGAAELIDDLHTAGHATACLSNTNTNHWRIMTDPADPHGQALSRLTHKFASHLIGHRKPQPETFAHVERETGIPPTSIIFFDDIPENVAAAQERGWTAHVVEICDNPIPAIRRQLRYDGLLP
jgi:HAD superfamily hydrolase (TIGR01509 family)